MKISRVSSLKNSTDKAPQEHAPPILTRIREVLGSFQDPLTRQNFLDAGLIDSLSFDRGRLSFAIKATPDTIKVYEPLRQHIESTLQNALPTSKVFVALTAHRAPSVDLLQSAQGEKDATQKKPKIERFNLPQIRHVVAVASGKGGVGKSMVCLNLALSLQKKGLKVGVLDLDIYGPSLPKMTGLSGPIPLTSEKKLTPPIFREMPVMSMGFLVPPDAPLIWRGPMIQTGVRQLFMDVAWPTLDILLLDLPPGTGDTQLTLAQKAPLTGAILVSTPQDLALADAKKGLEMFRKLEVPMWGLLENMASYQCPHCHQDSHPFSRGGVSKAAQKAGIPLLGHIPLSPEILQAAEDGNPVFLDNPASQPARLFHALADHLVVEFIG